MFIIILYKQDILKQPVERSSDNSSYGKISNCFCRFSYGYFGKYRTIPCRLVLSLINNFMKNM